MSALKVLISNNSFPFAICDVIKLWNLWNCNQIHYENPKVLTYTTFIAQCDFFLVNSSHNHAIQEFARTDSQNIMPLGGPCS